MTTPNVPNIDVWISVNDKVETKVEMSCPIARTPPIPATAIPNERVDRVKAALNEAKGFIEGELSMPMSTTVREHITRKLDDIDAALAELGE